MSVPTGNVPPGGVASRRQKRMGPAPFASFEDLSDELESPDEKNATGSVVRLPGIREDATPTPGNTPAPIDHPAPEFVYSGISLVGLAVSPSPQNPKSPSVMTSSLSASGSHHHQQHSAGKAGKESSLQAPKAPRIDISRASSSSHHDSKDSTPDRELFDGHDPASAKLGLGFREEGALDLRSSTEELDFQDQTVGGAGGDAKKKGKTRPQSPSLHDDPSMHQQRKDSQCSEIGLLSISGRTSRLSSIGSQGSAQSRLSNASHLSVISGQSGLSRSPSPHKMLLETSFCGTKPPENTPTNPAGAHTVGTNNNKVDAEVLEQVLLSRKHDPTEAVLAEGISVDKRVERKSSAPEKPVRKTSTKSDITIKVSEPSSSSVNIGSNKSPTSPFPKRIVAESGVEYIYIPLKGPLPVDDDPPSQPTIAKVKSSTRGAQPKTKAKVREVKSATLTQRTSNKEKIAPVSKSATPSPVVHHRREDDPKYIRIKLKPDYMYSQEEELAENNRKPDSLDLGQMNGRKYADIVVQKEEPPPINKQPPDKSLQSTPSASPKPSRHGFLKDLGSKTPSPSLSRKSSFASLFRSKEAIVISPESPTVSSTTGCRRKNTIAGILTGERSRSRSKSRDRDRANLSAAPSSSESIDSTKSKQKSVFSIFKSKKTEKNGRDLDSNSTSGEVLPSIEGIAKVEFKFNDTKKYYETPLKGESIRIPLHSPTHYDDDDHILHDFNKASSQDSQDTVIEAPITKKDVESVVIEAVRKEIVVEVECNNRRESTTSENDVFATKLGNNNEAAVFSTKFPKNEEIHEIEVEINGSEESTVVEDSKTVRTMTRTRSSISVTETVLDKNRQSSEEPKLIPKNNRQSTADDERCYSSESERDSEIDLPKSKKIDMKLDLEYAEPERKGLVLQQDSYEDELPYIPTTLPQERSSAVPIVPIKARSTFEMKTCPIERPRSTTPINPNCLEEYCEEVMGNFNVESVTKTIEKLKISLPRHESVEKPVKSPRKAGGNTWFEFAEKGISATRRSSLTQESDVPPPLPPKGVQKEWINFEEIPERRKPPKRIQTLPSRGHIEVPDSVLQDNVVYNYVNPDECKCECHEITAREREKRDSKEEPENVGVQEDELPLLDDDQPDDDKNGPEIVDRIKLDVAVSDRRSVVSDSSVDLSVEPPEANGVSLGTPFTSDLGVLSNRSSIVSQDEPQSPDSGSPNAFPKTF